MVFSVDHHHRLLAAGDTTRWRLLDKGKPLSRRSSTRLKVYYWLGTISSTLDEANHECYYYHHLRWWAIKLIWSNICIAIQEVALALSRGGGGVGVHRLTPENNEGLRCLCRCCSNNNRIGQQLRRRSEERVLFEDSTKERKWKGWDWRAFTTQSWTQTKSLLCRTGWKFYFNTLRIYAHRTYVPFTMWEYSFCLSDVSSWTETIPGATTARHFLSVSGMAVHAPGIYPNEEILPLSAWAIKLIASVGGRKFVVTTVRINDDTHVDDDVPWRDMETFTFCVGQ